MVEAYNFTGSWQLFPEKGVYQRGERPKSAIYKIENGAGKKEILISSNWYTLLNEAFGFSYIVVADGEVHTIAGNPNADAIKGFFTDALTFVVQFLKEGETGLTISHELQPNGYLRINQQGVLDNGEAYTNTEIFHKQLSVIPYSASVSGAVIKPTEEGVIRHKALTAMEEQTNMQLEQIRKQIELLAIQAQEIQMRKELSLKIYGAKLSFKPVIGQLYYLYERKDGSHLLSLISPAEYGGGTGPYKAFIAPVKLLADHTWVEV